MPVGEIKVLGVVHDTDDHEGDPCDDVCRHKDRNLPLKLFVTFG